MEYELLMEDLMYANEQADSTDANYVDCIKPGIKNSVHESSVSNSISDVAKVTHHEDEWLRSDSFCDEWQDFTTSVNDGRQSVPLTDDTILDSCNDNNNSSTSSEIIDFVSLSKTVLRQCFTCGKHNHSQSHNDDIDCQDE